MNSNQFFLKVSVQGATLDPLKFYEYPDCNFNGFVPTVQESIVKAEAYTRMKLVKAALSDGGTPIYFAITSYGTGGTARVVPTAVEMVVGFMNPSALYEFYEASKDLSGATVTEAEKINVITAGLKAKLDSIFTESSTNQGMEVVAGPVRSANSGGVDPLGQHGWIVADLPAVVDTIAVEVFNGTLPTTF